MVTASLLALQRTLRVCLFVLVPQSLLASREGLWSIIVRAASWFLAGHELVSLSEQQLTSCDRNGGDTGCGGGSTNLDTDDVLTGVNAEYITTENVG